MPAPNTLKRWNGATWVSIFDHSSYVSDAGDFMTGSLTLRNAALIGTDATGVTEWGRVTFNATSTTLLATGASKTVDLATNAITRFSVADTVVTSTLPIMLPNASPSDINHAARKKYVDDLVAPLISAATAESTYVNVGGDVMTGALTINATGALTMNGSTLTLKSLDPSGTWEAVPLSYLNTQVSTLNTSIALKVAKAGDEMSGLLHLSGPSTEKLKMSGAIASHIAGWTFTPATSVRMGYLNFLESGGPPYLVRLAADTGNNLALWGGGGDRFMIGPDGISRFPSTRQIHSLGQLRLGVSGTSLVLATGSGLDNQTYMAFYQKCPGLDDPLPARSGYIGYVGSTDGTLSIRNETGDGTTISTIGGAINLATGTTGNINLTSGTTSGSIILDATGSTTGSVSISSGAAAGNITLDASGSGDVHIYAGATGLFSVYTGTTLRGRFDSSGHWLVKKAVIDLTEVGLQYDVNADRLGINSAGTNAYNIRLVHTGDGNATGSRWIEFLVSTSLTSYGSIQQGVGNVTYGQVSHGPFKGNINDLNEEEATDRIMRMRPISHQWRYDKNGDFDEEGEPSGPFINGFVAQELYEVQPQAVAPGFGTREDRLAWVARRKAAKSGEPVEDDAPFRPWETDNAKLVPDLVATVRRLVRRVRALEGAS